MKKHGLLETATIWSSLYNLCFVWSGWEDNSLCSLYATCSSHKAWLGTGFLENGIGLVTLINECTTITLLTSDAYWHQRQMLQVMDSTKYSAHCSLFHFRAKKNPAQKLLLLSQQYKGMIKLFNFIFEYQLLQCSM